MDEEKQYNDTYRNKYLNRIAFPMGGIGSGMICMEGTGALSHLSIRNQPNIFNEPPVFSALCIKGEENVAKILEGPVQEWKKFGVPGSGTGAASTTYGLPRFLKAEFTARFPFAYVDLSHDKIPVDVSVTGWSPFIPGDSFSSSLPCCGLEYRFANNSKEPVEAVYSFNAMNFIAVSRDKWKILQRRKGFILCQPETDQKPWEEGYFCASVDDNSAVVDCAWFRGRGFDSLTMAWNKIKEGKCTGNSPITEGWPAPGASIYVPFELKPEEEKKVRLMFSWYVPVTNIRIGEEPDSAAGECSCGGEDSVDNEVNKETYTPWYAGQFNDIDEVAQYWSNNYHKLLDASKTFSDSFYNMTLPDEVIEAVAANLTILKSPTVLRQTDGRLWCWEGCCDSYGCCHGSCTHVWNYAQALPHLFPDLERTLRQTEFNECQNEEGHQNFRADLPIRPTNHDFHAAADGQLGGIMKVYREWRISGDTEWMSSLWPRVKASLDYCIKTWDPDHKGVVERPHHNTYDIEFWGPDGMCSSFYLGALKAAVLMGNELSKDVSKYEQLLSSGIDFMENELFDGEYFMQKIQWKEFKEYLNEDGVPFGDHWPEAVELMKSEGPKYQYGKGCLSDGVLGAWIGAVCGIDEYLDEDKIISTLNAIFKYNFRENLYEHENPQRPAFAFGSDGGLLLCTWPKGDNLSLPFIYSNEVWTGIEYQVASHLMMKGMVKEGLKIVRKCRDRYDGEYRNSFNEYECGHWYARAMASYGLLQGLTGIRYDAITKTLYIKPSISGDFTSFLSTATGFGNVGVRNGKPFVNVKAGVIDIESINYEKYRGKI